MAEITEMEMVEKYEKFTERLDITFVPPNLTSSDIFYIKHVMKLGCLLYLEYSGLLSKSMYSILVDMEIRNFEKYDEKVSQKERK